MLQIHDKDVVVYDGMDRPVHYDCPRRHFRTLPTLQQRLERARIEIGVNVAKMSFQPNCDEIPYFKQMGYYDNEQIDKHEAKHTWTHIDDHPEDCKCRICQPF
jgi:hypothetical protein